MRGKKPAPAPEKPRQEKPPAQPKTQKPPRQPAPQREPAQAEDAAPQKDGEGNAHKRRWRPHHRRKSGGNGGGNQSQT